MRTTETPRETAACQYAVARQYEYLDGELPSDEAAMLREHLRVCAPCSQRFAFDARLLAGIREQCRGDRAPAELRRRIHGLLDRL